MSDPAAWGAFPPHMGAAAMDGGWKRSVDDPYAANPSRALL